MWNFNDACREKDYIIVLEKCGERIGRVLFAAFEIARMKRERERRGYAKPPSLERYRPIWGISGHPTGGRKRGTATVGKWGREKGREREGSRCIDRRHKIHFMTWTLSSDWCISRRIASQIKRSSTLEPPLTTSPGPRRRRTMPSTLVCISHPAFSLFIYTSLPPFRDTRRQVYRQKLTS